MATSISFTQKGEEWLAGVLAGVVSSTPTKVGTGTGTTAAGKSDAALGTEVESRVTGARSQVGTNGDTLRVIATTRFTANRDVSEFGLFSSDGTFLIVRAVFSGVDDITVANGDSIIFTLDFPVT